jgi:hypothetical protein
VETSVSADTTQLRPTFFAAYNAASAWRISTPAASSRARLLRRVVSYQIHECGEIVFDDRHLRVQPHEPQRIARGCVADRVSLLGGQLREQAVDLRFDSLGVLDPVVVVRGLVGRLPDARADEYEHDGKHDVNGGQTTDETDAPGRRNLGERVGCYRRIVLRCRPP